MEGEPEGNQDSEEEFFRRFFNLEDVLSGEDARHFAVALNQIRNQLVAMMAWSDRDEDEQMLRLIKKEQKIKFNHHAPRLLRWLLLSGITATILAENHGGASEEKITMWFLNFLASTFGTSILDIIQFESRTNTWLKKLENEDTKNRSNSQ